MEIDWFTVAAQIVNFVLLVALLKRFLYGPILDAIEAREASIASKLDLAEKTRAEASAREEEYRQKSAALDAARDEALARVAEEAEGERRNLLARARAELDELSRKREEKLKNDAENLKAEVARRTAEEVFSIARKALSDLADAELDEMIAAHFLRRIEALDEPGRREIGAKLLTGGRPLVVRSPRPLSEEAKGRIAEAVREKLFINTPVSFEVAAELAGGVELSSDGYKLAWSLSDYLAGLEKRVLPLLRTQTPAGDA